MKFSILALLPDTDRFLQAGCSGSLITVTPPSSLPNLLPQLSYEEELQCTTQGNESAILSTSMYLPREGLQSTTASFLITLYSHVDSSLLLITTTMASCFSQKHCYGSSWKRPRVCLILCPEILTGFSLTAPWSNVCLPNNSANSAHPPQSTAYHHQCQSLSSEPQGTISVHTCQHRNSPNGCLS